MKIRVEPDNLSVLKNSFSSIEKEIFCDAAAAIGSDLTVVEMDYIWLVSGNAAKLWYCLNTLSNTFDIEII